MKVYLLTNKVTHARAVVIAESETQAVRVHPTDDTAHRLADDRGWSRYKLIGQSSHLSSQVLIPVDPPAGWPIDMRVGPPGQEGPDETWGGYTLANLTHFGPHERP